LRIDPILKEIASVFNSSGKEIYLVGGAVRDMLMGKKVHDWDLTTNALPGEVTDIVRRIGGKTVPTGIKHGTVTVLYKKASIEVTTFRIEEGYTDGRRPDQVSYSADINEDLSRRDFTMNAIALRLSDAHIVDPFNGKKDITARIIRCVGNAADRFNEDGLRPLRAVRFASQLDFEIEPNTLNAIHGALKISAKVSWERVRDEIDKILASNVPSRAFLLMEKSGLLELFLPELAVCRGVEQKGYHEFDVLDHSLLACDFAAEKDFSQIVRLAALFHDIGKPSVRGIDEETGVCTFYRHEEASADMCRAVMERLRYPNLLTDSVCHLIKEHMFKYQDDWSDAAVRRFIARVGETNLKDIYSLRRCDTFAFSGKESKVSTLTSFANRIDELLAQGQIFSLKDLAVSGNDLMTAGIPAGKMMGMILKELMETVLDDPAQNTRERLMEIAGKIFENKKCK